MLSFDQISLPIIHSVNILLPSAGKPNQNNHPIKKPHKTSRNRARGQHQNHKTQNTRARGGATELPCPEHQIHEHKSKKQTVTDTPANENMNKSWRLAPGALKKSAQGEQMREHSLSRTRKNGQPQLARKRDTEH